jgi:hypothetical protein
VRVPVRVSKEGVCEVLVDEQDHSVHVRVLMCYPPDASYEEDQHWMNCPVHVYLDEPLNDRTVVDVQTGEALPLFVPDW